MSSKSTKPGISPRPTVLIVENREDVRTVYVRHVRQWRYEPIVALGTGRALIEDAKRKAQKECCCVALIDIRLENDEDPKDNSGLLLAEELHRTTACIIVTAYGETGPIAQALKEKRIIDYVEKLESPKRLRQALDDAFEKTCRFSIVISGYTSQEILTDINLHNHDVPEIEVEYLIKQLYSRETPPVTDVLLKPIDKLYTSNPSDGLAVGERSKVLVAQARDVNGWRREEIIKIALRDRIEQEIENYRWHVRDHLPPHRTARIEDFDERTMLKWHIGAIRYTYLVHPDILPLRRWYPMKDTKAVKDALTDLFTVTLEDWYTMDSTEEADTVYHYYSKHYQKLNKRIEDYKNDGDTINIPRIFHRLPDPVLWVKRHRDKSRFVSHWQAYSHGDLHRDNIFIDHLKQTFIIDFERSGPGYILRDFAELEVDIRLRLLELTEEDLPLAGHLDTLLFTPNKAGQKPTWQNTPKASDQVQAELRKAFEVICELRQYAFQTAHYRHMQEYYWAVLMETLISVLREYDKWPDQAAARLARNRALLSAGIICARLEHWNKSWPPAGFFTPNSTTIPPWHNHRRKPGSSRAATVGTQHQSTQPMFTHGYALIIGVGQTRYNLRWSLPVSVNDAVEMKKALENPSYCAYPEDQIITLHNQTATADNIRDGLTWLADHAERDPHATMLVYFSGHGWQHQNGRYALIPSDVRPKKFESSVLWDEDFTRLLHNIHARRLLVLIDACHAGGVVNNPGALWELPVGFSASAPPEDVVQNLKRGDGRAVISSSLGRQRSYVLKDESLSIFTYHLLEVLQGVVRRPGEKMVKVSHLMTHLSQKVPTTARTMWQALQEPWVAQSSIDFEIGFLPRHDGTKDEETGT